MRKRLVDRLCSQGILIEPAALKMLQAGPEPLATLEKFLGTSRQNPLVITGADIRKFLEPGNGTAEASPAPAPTPPSPDEEEPDDGAGKAQTGAAMYMDASDMLTAQSQPKASVEETAGSEAGESILKTAVEPSAAPYAPKVEHTAPVRRTGMGARAISKGYDPDVAVIQEITDESRCTGQASDFKNYFEDRLRVLGRLLKQRPEMGGAVKVEDVLGYDKRDARVICMVSDIARPQDKRVRGTWLTVEDETGTMRVWLPDEGGFAAKHVLKDEVIGIVGKVQKPKNQYAGKDRGNYIVAQQVVRPELVGPRTPRRSENPLVIACAGDLHVGSSHFLPKPWEKIVSWLKSGDGTAGNVKYLLMPGDMVDGIGIYPNQDEELEIDDVYLQYERLATMLAEIPDHIHLIILPGNHDAQRLSEPQPALPNEVKKIIGTRPSYVGNPSYLMVDGVRVLAYHGRGFDDLAGNLGSIGYQQPMELMKEMLKRRHMSPIYGGKNQLAPERRDYLVINPVPDIFVTGHVHGAGIEDYKGVVNINASTLQAQTPFQASHNFNPDPGKVPWVRLDTFEFGMENFY